MHYLHYIVWFYKVNTFEKIMTEKMLGSYQFDKNENFEEFLSATGVPFVARKMMVSTSPSLEISKQGDMWALAFKVLLKSNTISFELGKEFSEENPILGVKQRVNKIFYFNERVDITIQ